LRPLRIALAGAVSLLPAAAHASFLHGDTLDAFANGLAWFILIVMPLAAIGGFLYVHILPELIAERRHHPQKDAVAAGTTTTASRWAKREARAGTSPTRTRPLRSSSTSGRKGQLPPAARVRKI
jgi:hypothetical protein